MQNFNANLMQLVSGRYDYYVTRNCNFSVQNCQSYQELCNCNNFHLITINLHKFLLFSQHSCQVVYHRPPKLPGTENTFSVSIFSKKLVKPL